VAHGPAEQLTPGSGPGSELPERRDVVGTPISLTSYAEVLDLIASRPVDRARTFAFCNVHSVMTARGDAGIAAVLRRFDVATSDGVPVVWALRALGHRQQSRVYGPDLMELALPHGLDLGWRHYLYGATEETLDRLAAAAERLAPGVRIVGRHAPPFRPETAEERTAVLDDIRRSGADLVWVGLGMPKQERWIDEVRGELPGVALLAVGAAFDLLSGTVKQAPDWIQRAGLEWLYRLLQEPRRLWRRYLYNNPAFVLAFARQWAAERRR
jgi:N-acetylglucosaminyldiphosphoundecaprenol N-acetyl-beta-D-mannosaminyltransferase